jgi:hypothetical protein
LCEHLDDLCDGLARYVAGFDAGLLSTAQASVVTAAAARLAAMAHALLSLAADRAADAHDFRARGYRSAGEALARTLGTSTGEAKGVLVLGRRLSAQDTVRRAAANGELSASQASMIAEAAQADPSAQERLVTQARTASHEELKGDCQKTVAKADKDPEGRRRAIHERRSLRSFTDVGGTWHLSGRGNPEDGARLMAALAPLANARFQSARAEGRREAEECYRFDALLDLASQAVDGGGSSAPPPRQSVPSKILIRVDYDALVRGRVGSDDEMCDLTGYGPVPVSVARELIESGDPFIAAVLTRARAVVGVAHLGRHPTALQRSALQWISPTCSVAGCGATVRLEVDHRAPWASTHRTVLGQLDPLCHHHHRLKTLDGWALVDGSGSRAFVAPSDPRHPLYRASARTPEGP